jgi:hypothetical protein
MLKCSVLFSAVWIVLECAYGMTRYEVDGPGIEFQWDEIFRISSDRPWGPPSLLYRGYQAILGIKWPGRGLNLPPTSGVEFNKKDYSCTYIPTLVFMASSRENLTLVQTKDVC